MSKRQESKYKIDRRLNCNPVGPRQSPINKREYGPGQHGQRRKKPSEYGLQLDGQAEAQGLLRQHRRAPVPPHLRRGRAPQGDTGEHLIALLERRVDAIVYRAKFAPTIFAARQLVNHGHIKVNGRRVNIASYQVKDNDVIELKEKSREMAIVLEATGLRRARHSRLSQRRPQGHEGDASCVRRSWPTCPIRCRWSRSASSSITRAERQRCLRLKKAGRCAGLRRLRLTPDSLEYLLQLPHRSAYPLDQRNGPTGMTAQSLPALFISHGSPMLVFEDIPARHFIAGLGDQLQRPKAILCVSAHWETERPTVSAVAAPETIHDFYGFPDELYRLRYPAPGAPALARRWSSCSKAPASTPPSTATAASIMAPGIRCLLIYPKADVPVTQLSIQVQLGPAHHAQIGRALQPLRREGVLVLASGGAVHNLRQFHIDREQPAPWAVVVR